MPMDAQSSSISRPARPQLQAPALDLLAALEAGIILLADKAHDTKAIRSLAGEKKTWANIPPRKNRKGRFVFNKWLCKQRNLVEKLFNKLKNYRGIATRYDRDPENFLAAIKIIPLRTSIKTNEATPECVRSQNAASRVDLESFWFLHPQLPDEFIRCKASQSVQPPGMVVGFDEQLKVPQKLIMAGVVVAFDARKAALVRFWLSGSWTRPDHSLGKQSPRLFSGPRHSKVVWSADIRSHACICDEPIHALDYVRNGATTLFAALNILDRIVIGRCMQNRRRQEFIRFLNTVERKTPPGKESDVILGSYSSKKPLM